MHYLMISHSVFDYTDAVIRRNFYVVDIYM